VLVEHARNVAGIARASHAESPAAGDAIITPLSCSLDGRSIEVRIRPGTVLAGLHGGATSVVERTTCNDGLDPARHDVASSGGMTISAVDDTGEARAVERTDHLFFVATLYQPQLRSSPERPHPVWLGLLGAAARHNARVGESSLPASSRSRRRHAHDPSDG
jgi:CTP synthase (UTP-ammonia lyase)